MNPGLSIGLTGRMASGKGEVVRILQSLGFIYISLSDLVREEAHRLQGSLFRGEMQNLGNRMRLAEGAGVLGKRVREKIEKENHSHWVIDGIRNPAEIAELKKLSSFFLVGIDADIKIILTRMKNRGRDSDLLSETELLRHLEREWGIGEPADGQQVGACMKLCDYIIYNDASLTVLEKRVREILVKVGYEHD